MKALEDDQGSSAVELALVASVLVLLLFGIVQFGIAYNRAQGLNAAVREGARLAAVGGSETEVRDRVREAQSLFVAEDVAVTTAPAGGCATAGVGRSVAVTARVAPGPAYAIALPLIGSREITYTASGTFRCERVAS